MEIKKRFLALLAFMLLLLFGATANAQSDVRTDEQKVYFPQMDPVLIGMWMGNGDGAGMRYDPVAIACMSRACAILQEAFAHEKQHCPERDENCPYRAVRDSRSSLYQSCYAAHRARITQPGYTRLTNPPAITSLVCSNIHTHKDSTDEAIYTAVNGHPRPKPQYQLPVAQGAPPKPHVALQPGEADQLLAELSASADPLIPAAPKARVRAPASRTVVATMARPATKVAPSGPGGLPGFRVVSQNDKETVLRVLNGADYYTVERSYLAKDHDISPSTVMGYAGNDHAQTFFPYKLAKGKIELYRQRLHWSANDAKRLQPPDALMRDFIHECDSGGCEMRFALQVGETLRIPRKSSIEPAEVSAGSAPAPSAEKNDTEYVEMQDQDAGGGSASTSQSTAVSPTSAPAGSAATPSTISSRLAMIDPISQPDASLETNPRGPAKAAQTAVTVPAENGMSAYAFPLALAIALAIMVGLIAYARHNHKVSHPESESDAASQEVLISVIGRASEPPVPSENQLVSVTVSPVPSGPPATQPTTIRPTSGSAVPPEGNASSQPGTPSPTAPTQVAASGPSVVIMMPSGNSGTGGPAPPIASSGGT